MPKISLSKLVWAGLIMVIGGFFGGIGYDLYLSAKETIQSQPQILPIPPHWIFFGGILIVGVILIGYDILRKRKPTTQKESDISVTRFRPDWVKEILTLLNNFQSSWSGKWRPPIESGKLRSPENGEISWYSDQIRNKLSQAKAQGFPIKPHLDKQLKSFTDDAGKFGQRIREIFLHDWGVDAATYTDQIKQSFLEDGDNLVERLDTIIAQMEDAFPL
ncbi:MAG: hypothetical protein HY459_05025 [Parcubacteria group bacterium]|nr:hypothetical protein [Parcubacteria group bacterium]